MLYAGLFDDDAPLQFGAPVEETALIGAGTAHHTAWQVADDADELTWFQRLVEIGLRPTPAATQKYFHSFYFRMPDGNLIELATSEPGFLVDEESPESLGTQLSLPAMARAGTRDARTRAHPDYR